METTKNLAAGTRCNYSAPFLNAPITGVIQEDDVDGTLMFYADKEHHQALLVVGYEALAGMFLPDGTPDTECVVITPI